MDTVVVVDVRRYSPGDESAEVVLQSSKGEVKAFCWPCDLNVGDVVLNRLSALDGDVKAAYLSDWSEQLKETLSVERLEPMGSYAYRGVGRVVDPTEGLVEVLGFVIEFGDVPSDDVVEFEVVRLDVGRA